MARGRSQDGFSLIEVMVAMTILVIAALALGAQLINSAVVNKRVSDRQRALEVAEQQIERLRSLGYDNLKIAATHTDDPDWMTTFCPLRDASDNPLCAARISSPADTRLVDSALTASSVSSPQQPKFAPELVARTLRGQNDTAADDTAAATISSRMNCTSTGMSSCPTTRQNGPILYTYVYWNNWPTGAGQPQYKIVTVVARYSDLPSTASSTDWERYGTVRVSAVLADTPTIGQVQ